MQYLKPNTTLQGGKYRIERVLGQGGFGNTYVGYNTEFEETVAIKEFFMPFDSIREDNSKRVLYNQQGLGLECYLEAKENFKQIAEQMLAIKNDHIIDVSDVYEENDTVYYVMEYIDGENLKERMNRIGHPVTEEEVALIIPQLLDALKSIHNGGICHLDLKPSNIMIDKPQQIKLIDFGLKISIGQMLEDKGIFIDHMCTVPSYFAPELLGRQYQRIGPWTDFYLLGATLYNLLTNERPPHFGDLIDDKKEDKHDALPMPSNLTPKMRKLILWLMKVRIDERPKSVNEIQDFLAAPTFTVQEDRPHGTEHLCHVQRGQDLQEGNCKKRFWRTLLGKIFRQ